VVRAPIAYTLVAARGRAGAEPMPRLSEYLLPTEKDAPADAEAVSHRLMVRAGLVRQMGAGIWTWLPAGWRSHEKAVAIIREEIDGIGGQEMLMPVLQPAAPWRASGRYEVDALFKLNDRKGADLVLAMTHEEAVTTHVAQIVRSYRDLPLILYHVQVKERDEPRPRAGVLRTREFVMKDSYTFDRDAEGLEQRYQLHVGAYDRIMQRSGLRYYRVEADVGMMGGHGAHEYMAPCAAGENEVVLAGDYAANIEVASAEPRPVTLPEAPDAPQPVATPGLTTVADVAAELGLEAGALLKAYPVVRADDGRMVLVMLRGDHQVNEIKLGLALGCESALGPPGFIGPVGAPGDVEIVLDMAVAQGPAGGYVTGANRSDEHLRGVVPGRDFAYREVDVRTVVAGDTIGGTAVTIEPAIEIGNIFKLGTRYSEPLGASYLDENGREQPIWMGSYGIGPARIVAAAVEQYSDEHGISWPRALAPFDLHLVSLGKQGSEERDVCDVLYNDLREGGFDVIYDDRDAGPGEKFADAELLGCPLRLTVGRRSLESGEVEVQIRRGRVQAEPLSLDAEVGVLLGALRELWQTLP